MNIDGTNTLACTWVIDDIKGDVKTRFTVSGVVSQFEIGRW